MSTKTQNAKNLVLKIDPSQSQLFGHSAKSNHIFLNSFSSKSLFSKQWFAVMLPNQNLACHFWLRLKSKCQEHVERRNSDAWMGMPIVPGSMDVYLCSLFALLSPFRNIKMEEGK